MHKIDRRFNTSFSVIDDSKVKKNDIEDINNTTQA